MDWLFSTTTRHAIAGNMIGGVLTILLFLFIERHRGKKFNWPGLR